MEQLALAFGELLPWLLGLASLQALDWPRPGTDSAEGGGPGRTALRLGCAYFIGALLLTLWMRTLSAAGVGFGRASIGAPLLAATAALCILVARRRRFSPAEMLRTSVGFLRPPLAGSQRLVWTLLLAWIAVRLALLAVDVAWRPLYPWDAWTQWATKARVWYEQARIVPFVPADVWLAGGTSGFFDAAPDNPATIPLLQVWGCIALGHWDDSSMNWPWLLMALALSLAVYGALRDAALSPLGALLGAYFVASLPFLDAHVALAGYADLMLAGVYALAALALRRWAVRRDARDAGLALVLALACPLIGPSGLVWALTLVPGALVVLLPRRGPKLVGACLGLAALGLLAFMRTDTTILGYRLHLDYQPPWHSLLDAYLLLGNWHLLGYAVIALAIIGARSLLRGPLAPLAMIAASGLALLLVVPGIGSVGALLADFHAPNRALLHLAPLLVCLCVLLWRDLATAATAPRPALTATDA